MAKKFRCPRPVNRLLHMRAKGFSGPFMQNTGSGCVHTAGNAYAPGGPLAGAKPILGIVDSTTQITLTFSQCIKDKAAPCANPKGISVTADGVGQTVTGVTVSDISMTITVSTLAPGDEVKVSYDDSNGCFLECEDDDPVQGFTDFPVQNPLVLEGNYILLESGGSDVILLEDATVDPDDSIVLEDAPP